MEKENEEAYKDALSMEDVLDAQQANKTDITENCTYARGYLKRQPLYACLTCNPCSGDGDCRLAGICFACSLHCHEGHNLVELCTKRNFRCDCGNSKFPNLACKLNNSKSDVNDKNSYNQNFTGKFCTCHCPYLHPDNQVEDDMLQCVLCEDWIHFCHLDENLPNRDFDGEMICQDCMEKHPFLYNYSGLTIDNQNGSFDGNLEIAKAGAAKCTMPEPPKTIKRCTKYWQENWRQSLCKCTECKKMYEKEQLLHLLDEEDTIDFYENSEQFKIPLDLEQTMDNDAVDSAISILKTMDRMPVLNVINAYGNMKADLFNYLRKFADNKKIVREEDIIEFFQGWTARKKRRYH